MPQQCRNGSRVRDGMDNMTVSRILVVDDEEGMLEVCEDTLSVLGGVEVELESDSRRAAERLATETFDLLVTDIRMPGLDGIELLQRARRRDPHMSVLVLTGSPIKESAMEIIRLHGADHTTKPFVPEDLRAAVTRILREKCLRGKAGMSCKSVRAGPLVGLGR